MAETVVLKLQRKDMVALVAALVLRVGDVPNVQRAVAAASALLTEAEAQVREGA